MKYFFWIAFAVFLAASIPHVAYFFASFEPSQGPEGVWWWAVSYAIAISIDVTVYLLSWTAFQRYRRYRTARAVWQHWLLIVMCTVFSWAVNWAYAKQFHSTSMLSSAEASAPWLVNVFPFMASAFPLLGIVYTMMAETISETDIEEKGKQAIQLTALAELARQTNLPLGTLRRALSSASSNTPATALPAPTNQANSAHETPAAVIPMPNAPQSNEVEQPITGQIVAIQQETGTLQPVKPVATPNNASSTSSPDKLQMTLEALQTNPDISDEALAERLALKRAASARFWRLKAMEILSTNRETSEKLPIMRNIETQVTPAGMNGKH